MTRAAHLLAVEFDHQVVGHQAGLRGGPALGDTDHERPARLRHAGGGQLGRACVAHRRANRRPQALEQLRFDWGGSATVPRSWAPTSDASTSPATRAAAAMPAE